MLRKQKGHLAEEYFHKIRPENKRLQLLVDYFFELYQISDTADNCAVIFPSGCAKLIMHQAELPQVSGIKNIAWEPVPGKYIYLAQNKAHLVKLPKKLHVFGVKFFPWGIYPFTRFVPDAQESRQPLHLIFAAEKVAPLYQTQCFSEWQTIMENMLLAHLQPEKITKSYEYIRHYCRQELTSVQAPENGGFSYSQRHFQRLFKRYVFQTLSDFKKIKRFQSVLNNSNKSTSLTSLAYECGFSDQSHFIKDFKYITGLTPKQYFSNPFLNKITGKYFSMQMME